MRNALPVLIVGVLCSCGAMSGCEQNEASPSQSTASSGPIDWSKVTASPKEASLLTAFHLSRVVDMWHKGAAGSVSLRYEGDGVSDGSGHHFVVAKEDFKGIRSWLESSGKPQPVRAAPDQDYRDGLGAAKRNAYFMEVGPDNTLIFKFIKALDGESRG